jgi:uncharacterized phiE125 gp8 family phage protein
MQVRVKTGQSLVEPVTEAEFKTFSGYPGTDQSALIASMITAAREFLENETGVACISKVYEVEFDKYDAINEDSPVGVGFYSTAWYRLPFSPVTAITTVIIGGVTTTYTKRGLKVQDICPDQIIQTGTTDNTLAVTFTAGESNTVIKNAILRIVSDLFNNREDHTGVSMSSISFDTQRLISHLSTNTGF